MDFICSLSVFVSSIKNYDSDTLLSFNLSCIFIV